MLNNSCTAKLNAECVHENDGCNEELVTSQELCEWLILTNNENEAETETETYKKNVSAINFVAVIQAILI